MLKFLRVFIVVVLLCAGVAAGYGIGYLKAELAAIRADAAYFHPKTCKIVWGQPEVNAIAEAMKGLK